MEAQKLHAGKLLHSWLIREGELDMNLLLIHHEDHIASSSIAVEMSGELIGVYEVWKTMSDKFCSRGGASASYQ